VSFQSPWLLALVAVVPVWLAWYGIVQRRRGRLAARLSSPALLPNLLPSRPGPTRHIPAALLALAATFLLAGAARPERELRTPRDHAAVVLAIDASNSMRRDDVSPSRLAAAQSAADRFVERAPDQLRIGLVSFAAAADVRVAPTHERAPVRDAIASLSPSLGTAVGDAIERAVGSAGPALRRDRRGRAALTVLLLSDGRSTRGLDPLAAADRAAVLGVTVHTIALGARRGADPATLAEIAERTGGRTFTTSSSTELEAIYDDLGSRVGFRRERQEVTVAFVAAGALLTAAALASSARRANRII
jgi:Ca-activated chloride channel family protein